MKSMPASASKEVLKRFGVSRPESKDSGKKGVVDPFSISGAFLTFCVSKGWLRKEGSDYYATVKGKKELKKFGIKI